jgi:dihydroorotate dehydrogenase (NAD+) catalytic subunit
MAGASAVQVGTANLTRPQAALDVLDGIRQFMNRENLKNMEAIVGKARS